MANIRCASNGNKIRLKRKSPDWAMANASATIIGHQSTGVGPLQHSFTGCHGHETQNQAQEKSPDKAMANIQCASTENKIGLKKKNPDRAMADAGATIIGHQGIGMGPI